MSGQPPALNACLISPSAVTRVRPVVDVTASPTVGPDSGHGSTATPTRSGPSAPRHVLCRSWSHALTIDSSAPRASHGFELKNP